ncbi:MAG: hypothetical protein KTR25_17075 [Myxococcales bacterium]|nr:hypothetical protein [Myxococcales bacterium]
MRTVFFSHEPKKIHLCEKRPALWGHLLSREGEISSTIAVLYYRVMRRDLEQEANHSPLLRGDSPNFAAEVRRSLTNTEAPMVAGRRPRRRA